MSDIREQYDDAICDALSAWCASPMRWGVDDCALAVANIDRAVTGEDTAAEWRGRYRTERGARRVLGKGGLVKALARVARSRRWKRIKPTAGRNGDRGLVMTPDGAAVVVRHRGWWIGRHDYGFAAVADNAVRIAYSVGE